MESPKIPWFQTTDQITHYKVFSMSLCNKLPECKYTANQLFEDDSPVSKPITSSTAQGGGGSFKNGKPIGEVSWCDAQMAERTH